MKTKVFAIYDSKLRAYMQPFFSANTETGQRAFASAVADTNSQLNQSSSDFTLFQIAEYDDSTGVLTAEANQINLGLATQYKGLQS